MIKYFITPKVLTVIINGKQMFVPQSHLNYDTMCNALRQGCKDEKVIMDLFDLKKCMLVEFPNYVEIDENGMLVLKYCHEIDMAKFTKETLLQKRDGACVESFFILLSNMSQNKSVDTYQFLQWLKKKGYTYSHMGTILCYARVFDNDGDVLFADKRDANAIISIHPKYIKFMTVDGVLKEKTLVRSEASLEIEWNGNNEPVPSLENFNVFNGNDMLGCI